MKFIHLKRNVKVVLLRCVLKKKSVFCTQIAKLKKFRNKMRKKIAKNLIKNDFKKYLIGG